MSRPLYADVPWMDLMEALERWPSTPEQWKEHHELQKAVNWRVSRLLDATMSK